MRNALSLTALFFTMALATACNAGAENPVGAMNPERNDGGLASMRRNTVCEQTQCEQEVDACEQRTSSCRGPCFGDCFHYSRSTSPDTQRFCRQLCDEQCGSCDRDCSRDTRCLRTAYRFTLGSSDPALLAACNASNQARTRCGATDALDDCAVVSRWGNGSLRATYQCVAAQSCGSDPRACAASSLVAFGDEICSSIGTCDASLCTPETRAEMNGVGAVFRADVLEAARSCTREATCEDTARCLQAWLQALNGR